MSPEREPKAIVLIDQGWVEMSRVGVLLELNTEKLEGRWNDKCYAVPVTRFNLEDGMFAEIQFPVRDRVMKIFVPKHNVIAILEGRDAREIMIGFSS